MVFYLTQAAHAIPQILSSPISVSVVSASSIFRTASTASSSLTSVSAPSNTVTTVVASPTAPLSAVLPSQVSLPPHQAWCPSEIFCAGALLQTVNIAGLYSDPKTFVDKPTNGSSQAVLSAFSAINSTNVTEGAVLNFVDTNFKGEGGELEALTLTNFNPAPAFLSNVTSPLLKAWSQTVHGYWTQLIRGTNQSALCSEGNGTTCESSLIPLNHTFVVPGGRFREQYYWDSFWIIEGLLKSELYDIVNATLQNFMDEIETIGFIPNGGRIYYLNRSQPPLFIQMLSNYVAASNDISILERALPLAERELAWWRNNRSLNVTSPFTNKTYEMARYAVTNTAPRPESYLTDYNTANDPDTTSFNETQRSDLYSELASGAETGWDYTARFLAQPLAGGSNNTNLALRTLNVKNTIPICLNSILYKANLALADLYTSNNSSNNTVAAQHRRTATSIREGIIDLFWDATKLAFYDFNLTSNRRNSIFTAANFYPLWVGIIPEDILNSSSNAFGHFASLNMVLNRYNGTFPTTFLETGLQWDAPNAWPPHQYIALEALRAMNGTVVNGGNATEGEGWRDVLARELANRYFSSAFCSWCVYSTGGSIPSMLPRLSDQALNMFEKFSYTDIDQAGSGGEYTVQAGFGWTNGVVLWVASNFGQQLVVPNCPNPLLEATSTGGSPTSSSSGSSVSPTSSLGTTYNGNSQTNSARRDGLAIGTAIILAILSAIASL
ncbi:glycoside hydrolase family 37 protein [Heterobasidion irregulare TC 32-1]|uniref:Trehalase n=1 Tax=Heterobasidion irregulare (strain TC 32-1) TaxID=747525 RepID=W4KA15_HETIT|nr:glycoside hydrolase family 37 protein [Heterobasidion irregulare TC 32-1]ETW82190.1 glycoside hydrolase family 37 protein [Heterobasidion irregulare TC 32-1]